MQPTIVNGGNANTFFESFELASMGSAAEVWHASVSESTALGYSAIQLANELLPSSLNEF
eukprot:m.65718 g.65718  ORF g.65718 m.65718 type:complete len:60 (-) comp15928_c0_seq2:50-229(-)